MKKMTYLSVMLIFLSLGSYAAKFKCPDAIAADKTNISSRELISRSRKLFTALISNTKGVKASSKIKNLPPHLLATAVSLNSLLPKNEYSVVSDDGDISKIVINRNSLKDGSYNLSDDHWALVMQYGFTSTYYINLASLDPVGTNVTILVPPGESFYQAGSVGVQESQNADKNLPKNEIIARLKKMGAQEFLQLTSWHRDSVSDQRINRSYNATFIALDENRKAIGIIELNLPSGRMKSFVISR